MTRLEQLVAGAEVEWRTLGEVAQIKHGKDYKHLPAGRYPVYGSGGVMTHVDGFVYDKPTVLIPRKGSLQNLFYVDSPFWNVDTIYYTVIDPCHVVPKYLYYYLKNQHLERLNIAGAVPSLTQSALVSIPIPLPPLTVQAEIVRILDAFTASEAELEHELTRELSARRKQYAYYRDRLLSFEGEDVEWKTLGEVCMTTEKVRWSTKAGQRFLYIDLAAVDLITGRISALQEIDAESAPSRAQQVMRYEDVLFGLTRPTLGRCGLVPSHLDGQICSTGFCVLRADVAQVLPRYLFHSLKTAKFNGYVRENQEGTTYPAISGHAVKAYRLPIPPLARQAEIADVLDRLHALSHSLMDGLPAELRARRRQYEHYREQLLSFPGANSTHK